MGLVVTGAHQEGLPLKHQLVDRVPGLYEKLTSLATSDETVVFRLAMVRTDYE